MTSSSPISPAIDELWERRADLTPADEDARNENFAANNDDSDDNDDDDDDGSDNSASDDVD